MFKKIKKYLESLRLYVIADAKDNSISFSHGLYKRLNVMKQDEALMMCFKVSGTDNYAFMMNPPGLTKEDTQLADIMYDYTEHCVGFECLVPTVNRIFYDYGLPADTKWQLDVKEETLPNGRRYYVIVKPDAKSSRK